MIAEAIVKFYDVPRNRFICFLGAFFVIPVVRQLKREIARKEQELSDKTILLGRLELTKKLLLKWWEQ